jgi:hypothetical protein
LRELQATESIRKILVNKETDLERFRHSDIDYITELLAVSPKSWKALSSISKIGDDDRQVQPDSL